MTTNTIPAFLVMLSLTTVAGAQTKISGTAECAKPDQQHAIEVGDRPNHSFVIFQGKCTWTKPFEIAETKSKDHSGTVFQEMTGSRASTRGSGADTMENGDKFYLRWQGSTNTKDEMVQTDDGTWSFAGGTGKLNGIKGKGTYKGKGAADGTVTYEVEGEYELPTK